MAAATAIRVQQLECAATLLMVIDADAFEHQAGCSNTMLAFHRRVLRPFVCLLDPVNRNAPTIAATTGSC